jgi:hypothetical protein
LKILNHQGAKDTEKKNFSLNPAKMRPSGFELTFRPEKIPVKMLVWQAGLVLKGGKDEEEQVQRTAGIGDFEGGRRRQVLEAALRA